jgi:hypothetical protein
MWSSVRKRCLPTGSAVTGKVIWSRAYPAGHQAWGTGIVTHLPCSTARVPGLDEWFEALPKSLPRGGFPGDFNASRLLDQTLGERGNNEFFDRIADEGFVSIHRRFHSADERTYFKAGKAPHQLDYLYGDAPLAHLTTACSVNPHADVVEFSDHAPVIADFEL